ELGGRQGQRLVAIAVGADRDLDAGDVQLLELVDLVIDLARVATGLADRILGVGDMPAVRRDQRQLRRCEVDLLLEGEIAEDRLADAAAGRAGTDASRAAGGPRGAQDLDLALVLFVSGFGGNTVDFQECIACHGGSSGSGKMNRSAAALIARTSAIRRRGGARRSTRRAGSGASGRPPTCR